jgi:hypothetical protein
MARASQLSCEIVGSVLVPARSPDLAAVFGWVPHRLPSDETRLLLSVILIPPMAGEESGGYMGSEVGQEPQAPDSTIQVSGGWLTALL